jgi:hypothetical protein
MNLQNPRLDTLVSAAMRLPDYSGWTPIEIKSNILEVMSSKDPGRTTRLTSALGLLDNYSGWKPEEIGSNLLDIASSTEGPIVELPDYGAFGPQNLRTEQPKEPKKPEMLSFSTAPSDIRGGTGVTRDLMEPPEMVAERYRATGESESALESFLQQMESAATYRKDPEELTAGRFQANPVASAVGTGVGMVAPALVGGQAIIKGAQSIPGVANLLIKYGKGGKAAFDALSRMSVAGGDYTVRNHEEMTSSDSKVRNKALAGLAATMASAGASVAPELLKSGWWQPILQGLTAGATNVAAQKALGEDPLAPEAAANTIFQTALGGVFGLGMAKGTKIPAKTGSQPGQPASQQTIKTGGMNAESNGTTAQKTSKEEGVIGETGGRIRVRDDAQGRMEAEPGTRPYGIENPIEKNNALIDFFRNNGYIYDEGSKTYVRAEPGTVEEHWAAFGRLGREYSSENVGTESPFGKSQQLPRAGEPAAPAQPAAAEQVRIGLDTPQKRAEFGFFAKLTDDQAERLEDPTADISDIDFSKAPAGIREKVFADREANTRSLTAENNRQDKQSTLAGQKEHPFKNISRWEGLTDPEKVSLAEKIAADNPEGLRSVGLKPDPDTGLWDQNDIVAAIDDYRSKVYSERSEANFQKRQQAAREKQSEPNLFNQKTIDPKQVANESGLEYKGQWETGHYEFFDPITKGNITDTDLSKIPAKTVALRNNFQKEAERWLQEKGQKEVTFSEETGTLPGFEDTRKPWQIEQARREQERKAKQREQPLEGTMFDQNEMEARATQQEDMFSSGLSPEEKIGSMKKELAPTVMGGVKYDPTSKGNLPKYAGNVNIDRIGSDYDAKRAINDIADEYRTSIEANRGAKATHEETVSLSEQIGLSAEQLLKRRKGEVWDRAKTLAARDLHIKAVERLVQKKNELLKKRANGEATDQDMVDFLLEEKRVAAIQAEISGLAAESGRLLESFKILSEGKRARETFENIREKIEGSKTTEAILDGLAKIDDNDITTISKFINRANKTTIPERINRYFIESILSALPTDEANIAGNSMFAGMRTFLETPASALAEKVVAPLQGRKPEIQFLETKHEASGLINSIVPAWKALTKTLLTGEQKYIPKPTEDVRSQSKSKWAAVLPTRRLAAEDEFFKTLAFGAKIKGVAYRTAKREGLSGKAMNKRIDEIIRNPELYPEEYAEAWNEAKYRTFTDDPGEITKAINKVRRSVPGKMAYYVIPFLNTPVKILKSAMERLPVTGEIALAIKANRGLKGKEISEQIGKMIPAHLLAIPLVIMARSGLITGSGPSKKEEKNVWNQTHQPYSVKVGDKYYSYTRFDPMSSVVGMVADFANLDVSEENKDKIQEAADRVAYSIQQNIYNKTFFAQLEAMVSAAQDPGKYGEKFVANIVGSAIPNIVAKAGESFDPYVRQRSNVKDILKSRVPGMSQSLFPKRNLWGEPIERGKTGVAASVSPVSVRKISTKKVDEELNKIGFEIKDPSRNILGVKLNDEQYDYYQQVAGEKALEKVTAYINSDIYKTATEDRRRDRISMIFDNARTQARVKVNEKFNLSDVDDLIRSSRQEPKQLFNDLKKSGINVSRSEFWKKYNRYHTQER